MVALGRPRRDGGVNLGLMKDSGYRPFFRDDLFAASASAVPLAFRGSKYLPLRYSADQAGICPGTPADELRVLQSARRKTARLVPCPNPTSWAHRIHARHRPRKCRRTRLTAEFCDTHSYHNACHSLYPRFTQSLPSSAKDRRDGR